MRLPPPAIIRDEPPPDDLLLVVRGGQNALTDEALNRATSDCWNDHGFFGISVFGAPDDDLVALDRQVIAMRRRPVVRTARCGKIRSQGFEVWPTFTKPLHFSIVLAEATTEQFGRLRSCFGEAIENPGYEASR